MLFFLVFTVLNFSEYHQRYRKKIYQFALFLFPTHFFENSVFDEAVQDEQLPEVAAAV